MGFLDPSSWAKTFDNSAAETAKGQGIMQLHALNLQTAEQEKQRAERQKLLDEAKANWEPYKQVGETGAKGYQDFVSGNYNLEADPLYTKRLAAGTRQATQRAAGLGQSQAGGALSTRLAQLADDIYSNTYQTKYQQLTDAMKVGQGAAGSIQNAGATYGNQLGSGAPNYQGYANSMGNVLGSLYSNQQQAGLQGASNLMGGIGTAMNLYNTGRQAGWWGGNGGNESSAALANSFTDTSGYPDMGGGGEGFMDYGGMV